MPSMKPIMEQMGEIQKMADDLAVLMGTPKVEEPPIVQVMCENCNDGLIARVESTTDFWNDK